MSVVECKDCGKELGSHSESMTLRQKWEIERRLCIQCYRTRKSIDRLRREDGLKTEEEASERLFMEGSLFSDEMTEEEIREWIQQDMKNLKYHESGTGWDRFFTALTGSAIERLLAEMLKAIVDQNKILIRQNELILRSLARIEKLSKR